MTRPLEECNFFPVFSSLRVTCYTNSFFFFPAFCIVPTFITWLIGHFEGQRCMCTYV